MSTLLGEVVSWDLDKAETTYSAVQDCLRDAGLDPEAAKELRPRSAFSRACKDLKDERSIDKVRNEDGLVRFQFTKKTLAGSKIDFDYECVLSLDTDSGAISCDENPELEKTARELFAHAIQSRNAQDITRLVQKMFIEHADLMPISKKGVAYFVPEAHRAFTAKVADFLQRLGGKLTRFPVPTGTAEGNASVKEAVENSLSVLVDELNAAVEGWDESTRKSTMDKQIEKWKKISYKVEVYDTYLGSEQERLKDELAKAKQRLADKITQLKPDEKEAETTAQAA